MKKIFIYMCISFVCSILYGKERVNILDSIPDPIFKSYVQKQLFDGADFVTIRQAKMVDTIHVEGLSIKSLKGLEYFTNLKFLACSYNALDAFDSNSLPISLEFLSCNTIGISSLHFNHLVNLKTLHCGANNLRAIDLSNLEKLEKLDCGLNKLSSIDLSKLRNLKYLDCSENTLENLNISNLDELRELRCFSNRLIKLDLTNQKYLDILFCYDNQIIDLDLTNQIRLSRLVICEYNESCPKSVRIHKSMGCTYMIPEKDDNIYELVE